VAEELAAVVIRLHFDAELVLRLGLEAVFAQELEQLVPDPDPVD
jgi:hypothetical protein